MKGLEIHVRESDNVEDKKIVELYWERSEAAIKETEAKYGTYCHSVAYRILQSTEDAEECVNDTYLRAWEAMPPHKPSKLSSFLGKITRNLALNRYWANRAQKRSAEMELILDEVGEFLPDPTEQPISEEVVLREAINGFVRALPPKKRQMFVQRYFYCCSVRTVARELGMSENAVKVSLHRIREEFRLHLIKEGIEI